MTMAALTRDPIVNVVYRHKASNSPTDRQRVLPCCHDTNLFRYGRDGLSEHAIKAAGRDPEGFHLLGRPVYQLSVPGASLGAGSLRRPLQASFTRTGIKSKLRLARTVPNGWLCRSHGSRGML